MLKLKLITFLIKYLIIFASTLNVKTMIPTNTILYTKDGRRTGNAIVIFSEGDRLVAKTDYGNEIHITEKEMNELFYVHAPDEFDKLYQESFPHKHKV